MKYRVKPDNPDYQFFKESGIGEKESDLSLCLIVDDQARVIAQMAREINGLKEAMLQLIEDRKNLCLCNFSQPALIKHCKAHGVSQ